MAAAAADFGAILPVPTPWFSISRGILFAVPAHMGPHDQELARDPAPQHMLPLRDRLAMVEKDALESALRAAGGNRAKAARLLSTTERIFNYRVRKYGIDWRRFRRSQRL
jgi:Nif-specific regulatory protein